MPETTPAATQRQFPCKQCGADLKFAPGTEALVCPYCGAENIIATDTSLVEELDFHAQLQQARATHETVEVMVVKCPACGSEVTFDPQIVADECAFCGTSLVQTARAERVLKPQALLPFKVTQAEAREAFRGWIKGLWFAPNDVKKYARHDHGLQGIYLPHWTYDCETATRYTGRRGEYYYVNESYTATENGKTVTKTRRVRKTRWYPASGRVQNTFDDVLVAASDSLPRNYTAALEPWDLGDLVSYGDEYLSGFRAESYSVDLENGFELAKDVMAGTINATIRRDIGGDEQQILSKDTRYWDITFKHVLLPLWVSAYRYHGKVYRFLVNARTGEVQGERPWSWIKITLAVLLAIAVIAAIAFFTQGG